MDGKDLSEPAGSWRRLLPAIWMWVLLLAVNGVLGIVIRVTESASPGMLMAAELAGIPIVILCGLRWRASWIPMLGTRGLGPSAGLWTVAALGVIFAWMHLYFALIGLLGVERLNEVEDFVQARWPWWAILASSSLLPAAIEEIAFRGVIQTAFAEVGNEREAVFIQAGMFAFLHLSPAVFVSHFGFGLTLGFLRLRCRSLLPGMVVHALWNAFVVAQDLGAAGGS